MKNQASAKKANPSGELTPTAARMRFTAIDGALPNIGAWEAEILAVLRARLAQLRAKQDFSILYGSDSIWQCLMKDLACVAVGAEHPNHKRGEDWTEDMNATYDRALEAWRNLRPAGIKSAKLSTLLRAV